MKKKQEEINIWRSVAKSLVSNNTPNVSDNEIVEVHQDIRNRYFEVFFIGGTSHKCMKIWFKGLSVMHLEGGSPLLFATHKDVIVGIGLTSV
jgi:hypothetical protein